MDVTRGTRDYNAAISALNTLQSNFSIVDAIKKSGRSLNKAAIPEMEEWCRRIGYEPSTFDRLNPIHIAGTKGKGSTSAFISSILYQYVSLTSEENNVNGGIDAKRPRKIGLFTSPHLRFVRERIQIDNEPLSEDLFARYFFEVWDRLEASAAKLGPPDFATPPSATADGDASTSTASAAASTAAKPVYFRYLTLMALHAYISEGVDTAIIECGIGGEYDSTNILVSPTVAAVTSLGIDHTSMLGETIEDIAWHKAGIFKSTSKVQQVYTVDSQPPSAMDVLNQRATDKNLRLVAIPRHQDIDNDSIPLGLAADFQKTNASLAVAVAAAHLKALGLAKNLLPDPEALVKGTGALPEQFKRGLDLVKWGGRCEIRREGTITWHLDGGHTIESIKLAADWFASSITPTRERRRKQKRILLFNQQTRNADALATAMHKALGEALPPVGEGDVDPLFSHALFSTNVTFSGTDEADKPVDRQKETPGEKRTGTGRYKPDLISMNASAMDVEKLTVQKRLAETWNELDKGCLVEVEGTVEEAVEAVREIATEGGEAGEEVVVLVTGSLHLVGGVLEVLETTGV